MNRYLLPAVALASLAIAAAGSAQQADPSLQARNPKLKLQWAAPDARLPPFEKVMLAPVELQFREVSPMTGPTGYPGNRTDFPVAENDQREVAETFDRIFREELGASAHFALVDEPGAGVLLIRPALRDIVSRVPPQEPVGRSYVYVDSVGEATLVLDFIDAGTGRTLASTSDRRSAEPAGGLGDFGAVRANKVGAGQEVRRLARRWGMNMKRRVEQLYFDAKPK